MILRPKSCPILKPNHNLAQSRPKVGNGWTMDFGRPDSRPS